jgi:hypothetical protein
MERDAYLGRLREVGFTDVRIATEKTISLPDDLLAEHLDGDQVSDVRAGDAGLQSVTVVGYRPGSDKS